MKHFGEVYLVSSSDWRIYVQVVGCIPDENCKCDIFRIVSTDFHQTVALKEIAELPAFEWFLSMRAVLKKDSRDRVAYVGRIDPKDKAVPTYWRVTLGKRILTVDSVDQLVPSDVPAEEFFKARNMVLVPVDEVIRMVGGTVEEDVPESETREVRQFLEFPLPKNVEEAAAQAGSLGFRIVKNEDCIVDENGVSFEITLAKGFATNAELQNAIAQAENIAQQFGGILTGRETEL